MRTSYILGVLALTVAVARADPAADARALGERFAAAVTSGSVDAVLDCYVEDARVIFPGQGEEARGKPALRRMLEASLPTMKAQPIEQKSTDAVAIDDDHVLNVGRWELQTAGPDGRPARLSVRTTEILVRDGETWRYFVDHASIGVPAGPDPSSTALPPPSKPTR